MKTALIPLILTFFCRLGGLEVYAAVDDNESCKTWAEIGECDKNAGYMLSHCKKSCNEYYAEVTADGSDIAGIQSFFDLEAEDIDRNLIKFERFKGKATIVVNVASYCGYTESHYRGLVDLYNNVKDTERVEILAFPCNQFGQQEPEECPVIKRFAAKKGVDFTMMNKIDVNGPSASPVYKYLKNNAGPKRITWNFATYFIIGPDGTVQSFSGVEPMDLKGDVLALIDQEL